VIVMDVGQEWQEDRIGLQDPQRAGQPADGARRTRQRTVGQLQVEDVLVAEDLRGPA
jgi:hypothetical protein